MARNRSLRLDQDVAKRACRATSCPMQKGLSLYPVIVLIVLMLFTWIVAMWASCGENDEHHDEEKPKQSSDEQDHREAALTRIIHERFCCNRRSAVATSLRPAGSPLGPSTYCTSTHRVLTALRAGLTTRLSDFATNRHK